MQPIALTPKAFDVLHYLVTHPDRLVTKDILLDVVWPETAVSDVVVRIAIGELRGARGDRAQAPRFIAPVRRRGYRFVAPVAEHSAGMPVPASPVRPAMPPPDELTVLGYVAKLAQEVVKGQVPLSVEGMRQPGSRTLRPPSCPRLSPHPPASLP